MIEVIKSRLRREVFIGRDREGYEYNMPISDVIKTLNHIELLEFFVYQYRDDLRHPPSGDSIDRRLKAVNTLLSDSGRGQKGDLGHG